MLDALGRKIDYIRLSITDRCNQRCRYCMPIEKIEPITHADVLRYEEIMQIATAAVKAGVKNFKVTGGEPLVRKGCIDFLRLLKETPGVEHVTLTTNGTLLAPVLDDLSKIKIDGINISLDSLNADTYIEITGDDSLDVVLNALDKAVSAGLKVKINCVPMRGINDHEINEMASLAEKMPVDVRFIEFMAEDDDMRVTGTEVLKRLVEVYPDLALETKRRGFGPARYFKSGKMQGSIGIIDAVENCFCESCNRVRLTSNGYLKSCLFHDDGIDLRRLIRADENIGPAIYQAIYHKPKRHLHMGIENMSQIGG